MVSGTSQSDLPAPGHGPVAEAGRHRFVPGKASLILYGCMILLTAYTVQDPARSAWRMAVGQLRRIDERSLAFESYVVGLGRVPLDVISSRSISLTNMSHYTLHLAKPRGDCGCISLSLDSEVLPPGKATVLRVSVRAPSTPQKFAKHVTIQCQESKEQSWVLTLTGDAEADVWASPPRIEIEYGGAQQLTSRVVIHSNQMLQQVESGSPLIVLEGQVDAEPSAGRFTKVVTFRLDQDRMDAGGERRGASFLLVRAKSGSAPVLEVPVQWRPRAPLLFVPSTLEIKSDYGDPIQVNVTVFLRDRTQPSESVLIQPQVPWLSISDRKNFPGSITLTLTISQDSGAKDFEGGLLTLETKEGRMDYRCVLKRARQ